MACALEKSLATISLCNSFKRSLRIFKAPMVDGQRQKGVRLAPNTLIHGYNLDQRLENTMEYRHVTVHDSPNPQKTLFNNIMSTTKNTDDMVLTIGGDHFVSYFSIAAQLTKIGSNNLGVIWLDAHTDINSEKTSVSKNKHGMVVSGLLGIENSWTNRLLIPEYQLKPSNIVYIGVRDIDPPEYTILKQLGIKYYSSEDVKRHGIVNIMNKVLYDDLVHVSSIHLSYDVDVMDPSIFPCTGTPVSNGLSYRETLHVMNSMREDFRFCSMDLVEFNPELSYSPHYVDKCAEICNDMVMTAFT